MLLCIHFWARGLYRLRRKAVNRVGDSTDGEGILVYDDGTMYLPGIARELIVFLVPSPAPAVTTIRCLPGQLRISQFTGVLRKIFVQLSITPPIILKRVDTIVVTNDCRHHVDLSIAVKNLH